MLRPEAKMLAGPMYMVPVAAYTARKGATLKAWRPTGPPAAVNPTLVHALLATNGRLRKYKPASNWAAPLTPFTQPPKR